MEEPNPSKRIAFISVHGCPLAKLGSKDTGGMSVYIHQMALGLERLGFQVDIYTRAHETCQEIVQYLGENVRVIHVKAGPKAAPKESLFNYLPRFVSGVKVFSKRHKLTYNLIHSHYWLSGHVADLLSKEWKVPHVVTFHTTAEIKARARVGESEGSLRSATEKQVVANADMIVVSTPHEMGSLVRLYDADKGKIRVVKPGVDLDLFKPRNQRAARDQLGLNGHHTILYVGRLDPIKGLEVILHTLASLETPKHVQLLVAGGSPNGEEQERMQSLAAQLHIEDKVEFLGGIDHNILPSYYQAADVCVVPSYYESFGLVALEAMACGTPVIGSRVPGLEAIVKDNWTGYLVPWHCPDAFADRLEVLLSNNALRQSMGERGHDVAQGMGWEGAATALASAYADLEIPPPG